jgi:hypothetical protein
MASAIIKLQTTLVSDHTHRVAPLPHRRGLTSHFMAPPAEIRAARAFRTLDLCGESRAQLDGTLMLADSNPVVLYLRCLHDSAVSWLSAGPVAGVQAQRFLSIGASSSVS